MNDMEKYEFDRLGYLVIKDMLTKAGARTLSDAINNLEEHALARIKAPPRKKSASWGQGSRSPSTERGYHAWGERGARQDLDNRGFLERLPAFDVCCDHPGTMDYIRELILGRARINNSEIRIRYPAMLPAPTWAGRSSIGFHYALTSRGIDYMMVRMIYFLHDVGNGASGRLCVVPGTHKSNYHSPYGEVRTKNPGMIRPRVAGRATGSCSRRVCVTAGSRIAPRKRARLDPRRLRPALDDVAEHRHHGRAAAHHRCHPRPPDA